MWEWSLLNNPHRKHLLATTSHHRLNWLGMGMRSSGTFVGNNGSGMCLPQLIDWRVESSHLFFSSKDFADASWNSSIGFFPVHVMSGSNKWAHACRYLRIYGQGAPFQVSHAGLLIDIGFKWPRRLLELMIIWWFLFLMPFAIMDRETGKASQWR